MNCVKHHPILLPLLILMTFHVPSFSQIGGDNTYAFLNLTCSPRIAAMGGDFLTIYDNDITLASSNPSIINPEMHNYLGVSLVDYYTDVNYGHAAYSRTFDKVGSFMGA